MTTQETQVLELLLEGLTNKAIAARLGITEHGVRYHVKTLYGIHEARNSREFLARIFMKATRALLSTRRGSAKDGPDNPGEIPGDVNVAVGHVLAAKNDGTGKHGR